MAINSSSIQLTVDGKPVEVDGRLASLIRCLVERAEIIGATATGKLTFHLGPGDVKASLEQGLGNYRNEV